VRSSPLLIKKHRKIGCADFPVLFYEEWAASHEIVREITLRYVQCCVSWHVIVSGRYGKVRKPLVAQTGTISGRQARSCEANEHKVRLIVWFQENNSLAGIVSSS
jgi:hypothetical protein